MVQEDLGDPAHPDATDTHEVNRPNSSTEHGRCIAGRPPAERRLPSSRIPSAGGKPRRSRRVYTSMHVLRCPSAAARALFPWAPWVLLGLLGACARPEPDGPTFAEERPGSEDRSETGPVPGVAPQCAHRHRPMGSVRPSSRPRLCGTYQMEELPGWAITTIRFDGHRAWLSGQAAEPAETVWYATDGEVHIEDPQRPGGLVVGTDAEASALRMRELPVSWERRGDARRLRLGSRHGDAGAADSLSLLRRSPRRGGRCSARGPSRMLRGRGRGLVPDRADPRASDEPVRPRPPQAKTRGRRMLGGGALEARWTSTGW